MKKKKSSSRRTAGMDAIFCVSGEMVENNGEDSYAFSSDGARGLIAAFDGCGGIGARRYENYSGKTGAYIASRAVSGAVSEWYASNEPGKALHSYVCRALSVCDKYAGGSAGRMLGSLGKSFPTTAAITDFTIMDSCVDADVFWAGDSRCYCLDAYGLHQLSADDVAGEDAMSNLRDDGVLTNVISSSVPFEINCARYRFEAPCVLFAATDGCFGYISTPMQFEYLLLCTIARSDSINGWKQALDALFREYSSDDYTFCAAVAGYGSYQALAAAFADRLAFLEQRYILPLDNGTAAEEELWKEYSKEYYRYMAQYAAVTGADAAGE